MVLHDAVGEELLKPVGVSPLRGLQESIARLVGVGELELACLGVVGVDTEKSIQSVIRNWPTRQLISNIIIRNIMDL